MTYKTIFYFEAYGKVKEGKNVYCLDRQDKTVEHLNEMWVGDFVSILKRAEEHKNENRYEFWVEEAKEA